MSSYMSKRNEIICPHKSMYMNFPCSCFIINKKLKQSKCPPTDEWTNKTWTIHRTEYSAIKSNGVPIHATVWMKLENLCY